MSTIETDVTGNSPCARIRGAWVDAPERIELQQFLDGVNGLAQNAASAAATATTANTEAQSAKTVAQESASSAVTSLNETKSIANNISNASIAVEQAKQLATQAAASAGTSALEATQQAQTATVQAAKAKIEADKAIAAAAQQQDLMNQHVIAANPHSQYLQDAPRDGEQYVREDGGWAKVVIPEQGVQEAPADGKQYVRINNNWAVLANDLASFLSAVPRTLAFQHLNDNGYVAGQQICLWLADADIQLKNNLAGSVGMYILDSLHGALPSQGGLAIFSNYNGTEEKIGIINFNTNGSVTFSLVKDITIPKGKYLRFAVESLVGIWTFSVSLKHNLVGV